MKICENSKSTDKCKWFGSLLDFPNHIREDHPTSLIKLEENTILCWKIPSQVYKSDKGVFIHNNEEYLFETLATQSKLYFSLLSLREIHKKFRFTLLGAFSSESEHPQITSLDWLSPIEQRPDTVVIPFSEISHCNNNAPLKFTINIF